MTDEHDDQSQADGAGDEQLPPEVEARRAEARRLADTMRRVIERLVNTRAPAEGLAAAADRLEALVEWLDPYPQGALYEGFAEAVTAGNPSAFFDNSPLMGRANPLAPPIVMEVVGERVEGTVVFGTAYEGPPGCVHGGMIAAAFDDVLGLANTLSGAPGMTGTLTVKYRSPTPLHTLLRFEGQIDRREGRKLFVTGRCTAGEVLCAEAEAIFISIDREKFLGLKEQRDARMEAVRGSDEPGGDGPTG